MDSVKFRKAYIGDAEAIDQLNRLVLIENYTVEWIQQVAVSDTATVFVVLDGIKIIGYILVALKHDSKKALYGSIVSIAVLPEYRGQGYGKRLLSMAEQAVKDMKVGVMGLEVRKSNKRAQKLYLNLGYARIKKLKKYYKEGIAGSGEEFKVEDGYFMKKYL